MGFAIFLLPNNSLNQEIIRWKNLVKKKYIDSTFNNHPPHATIIYTELKDEIEAIKEIKKSTNQIVPFEITINHKSVFWNDKMTGGHTLYFGVKKNAHLLSFQKKIAEIIRPFKLNTSVPDYINKNKVLYESYKKYGFPFIGSHWLPHFTVASLMTNNDDIFIKNFISEIFAETLVVDEFSIWKVEGDVHTKIETISLI